MKEPLMSFKLYVIGTTPRSEQAIADLNHLCEAHWPDHYTIDIIDVLEQPQLAEKAGIVATPTLVKVAPPPVRQIIGDLSDTEQVLTGLGIHHDTNTTINRETRPDRDQ